MTFYSEVSGEDITQRVEDGRTILVEGTGIASLNEANEVANQMRSYVYMVSAYSENTRRYYYYGYAVPK